MAQSYVTFTGNGSSTGPITLGFNYILKAHVKVYEGRDILANTGTLKSETTHYTFNGAGTQISLVTAPANGVIITIERQTPNDDQIVPYADGSNLIADSLNNSDKQTLFCTQELEDRQALSAAKADAAKTASDTATSNVTTLTGTQFKTDGSVPMTGNINANSNKVVNLADPTSAQDAVTKAYLERTGSITTTQISDGTITNTDINASAAISGSKLQASSGSNAGSMSSAHYTKIEGIEASATADQSATEIKSSYESNSDTNAYTDAEKTKLSGIETSATADQSASEIKSSYESNSNTNAFTDANKTLVDAISATATEINYTTNVTSDIQSQINNKQPLANQLNTLTGMVQATASKLAENQTLTADINDLNQIDGLTKQDGTNLSDTDSSFPTSKAVVNYVAAQLAPIGGLEVVATEVAFPNTQPASGVVISISDAGGVVVNGSGVSTTGRTSGGATVTINGFPSSLQGETLVAGVGLMVSSTGSSQTYNYHKILGKEDDIKQLSDDINNFNERYRVENTLPAANSSTNHDGDLVWAKDVGKMYVYSGDYDGTPVGSFGEVQSIGNFYISTLSPAFNGTLQDFTITNAPSSAEQILLSINGVLQRPNAGNSTPSEGFALSGSTVKLAAAPASTDTHFAVVLGSTVNIGTPSDNTVDTDILMSGAVTGDKIATNLDLVDNKKIRFGTGNDLEIFHNANDGIIKETERDLFLVNTVANGQIIQKTDGNWLVSNQNQNEYRIKAFNNGAVELYYDNSKKLETTSTGTKITGHLFIDNAGDDGLYIGDATGSNTYIDIDSAANRRAVLRFRSAGTTKWAMGRGDSDDLSADSFFIGVGNSGGGSSDAKFTLTNTGNATFVGDVDLADSKKLKLGDSDDLQIYHDGSNSYIDNATGNLYIRSGGNHIVLRAKDDEQSIQCDPNGAVQLFYDNSKKFETASNGISIPITAAQDGIRLTASGAHYAALYADINRTGADENLLNIRAAWDGTSVGQILFKTGADTTNKDDGAIQFRTASAGSLVDSLRITNNGHLELPDSRELRIGTGDDLKIYHDGSNSYIKDAGTGDLIINATGVEIKNANDNETMATFTRDGSVDLYYNNVKTFETTSTGVTVTGRLKQTTGCAFRARPASNGQSIADNVPTKVNHGTEIYDYGNNYNTTTSQFTSPVNGVYHFDAAVRVGTPSSPCRFEIAFYIDGGNSSNTPGVGWNQTDGNNAGLMLSGDVYLNANQTVEVRIETNGGNTTVDVDANMEGYDNATWFSGHLVHEV